MRILWLLTFTEVGRTIMKCLLSINVFDSVNVFVRVKARSEM